MEELTLKKLTSKEIRLCIKKHIGAEELCEKYNCDLDELSRRIGVLFKNEKERNDIVKELRNTTRRPVKQAAKKVVAKSGDPEPVYDVVVDIPADVSADSPSEIPSETSVDEIKLTENELLDLRARESSLSSITMQHENDHVALAREHAGYIKDIYVLSDKISEFKAGIISLEAEYNNVVAKCNDVVSRMNQLSAQIYAERGELDTIRARIEELEQIVLAVSKSDIEVLSGPTDFVLDDSGSEELAKVLFDYDDLCAELRKREIHLLARVLKITEHAGKTVELIFDSEDLKAAYELYLETKAS